MEIEIRNGAYPVPSGSMHHLTVADGQRARVIADQEIMPNRETGSLVITTTARWTYLTLEPIAEKP